MFNLLTAVNSYFILIFYSCFKVNSVLKLSFKSHILPSSSFILVFSYPTAFHCLT